MTTFTEFQFGSYRVSVYGNGENSRTRIVLYDTEAGEVMFQMGEGGTNWLYGFRDFCQAVKLMEGLRSGETKIKQPLEDLEEKEKDSEFGIVSSKPINLCPLKGEEE